MRFPRSAQPSIIIVGVLLYACLKIPLLGIVVFAWWLAQLVRRDDAE